jgi:hypothetical protein
LKKKDGAKDQQKPDQRRQQLQFPAPIDYKLPEKLKNQLKRNCRKVIILSRITLKLNEADIASSLYHLVRITNFFMSD